MKQQCGTVMIALSITRPFNQEFINVDVHVWSNTIQYVDISSHV